MVGGRAALLVPVTALVAAAAAPAAATGPQHLPAAACRGLRAQQAAATRLLEPARDVLSRSGTPLMRTVAELRRWHRADARLGAPAADLSASLAALAAALDGKGDPASEAQVRAVPARLARLLAASCAG